MIKDLPDNIKWNIEKTDAVINYWTDMSQTKPYEFKHRFYVDTKEETKIKHKALRKLLEEYNSLCELMCLDDLNSNHSMGRDERELYKAFKNVDKTSLFKQGNIFFDELMQPFVEPIWTAATKEEDVDNLEFASQDACVGFATGYSCKFNNWMTESEMMSKNNKLDEDVASDSTKLCFNCAKRARIVKCVRTDTYPDTVVREQ